MRCLIACLLVRCCLAGWFQATSSNRALVLSEVANNDHTLHTPQCPHCCLTFQDHISHPTHSDTASLLRSSSFLLHIHFQLESPRHLCSVPVSPLPCYVAISPVSPPAPLVAPMSTSTRYASEPSEPSEQPVPPQPTRQESGDSDIDEQTKANTLANAAATSSSPAPHILSAKDAPKDELAMHNTPTSSGGSAQ